MASARKPSNCLSSTLFYANSRPTEADWRQIIWGPDAAQLFGPLGPGTGPIHGVASFEQAEELLAEFRGFLAQLIDAATNQSAIHELLGQLFERAQIQPEALVLNPDTGTIFFSWATENLSFAESLYARLVLTLEEVPLRRIRHCSECGTFFFAAHERPLRFCGRRCRNRVLVRRYRKEHRDEHRAYQRKLMKRRRAHRRDSQGGPHE